jgi:hypothetical protein
VVTAAAVTAPAGVALAALAGASPALGDLLAVGFGPAMAAVVAVVGSDLIYSSSINVAELVLTAMAPWSVPARAQSARMRQAALCLARRLHASRFDERRRAR